MPEGLAALDVGADVEAGVEAGSELTEYGNGLLSPSTVLNTESTLLSLGSTIDACLRSLSATCAVDAVLTVGGGIETYAGSYAEGALQSVGFAIAGYGEDLAGMLSYG